MDEQLVALLAHQAGLDKVWAEYRDDVLAAAAQALNNAGAIQMQDDPTAEPWPPMRPGLGL